MLPTTKFESIEEYLDVFTATYHDLQMMKPSDRKLELESRRKRLARLEIISEREFTIKFSFNGFKIQYDEIEAAMEGSRGNLDFDYVADYCNEFDSTAKKVIEQKTETQDLEEKEKQELESKEKGCFLCRCKKWLKKVLARKT